jgi:trehalose 6-phosphate phosphatase
MIRHHALSPEGRRRLRSLTAQSVLYGFDFDGTLAALSPDRGGVRLSRSVHEWLAELRKRAPCAVISGRSLSDLSPRINGAVRHVIGNHGLESPLTTPSDLRLAEDACVAWKRTLTGDAGPALAHHGVELEDKRYTLTLHYRGATKPTEVRLALTVLLNSLTPRPRLTFGHACVNALPAAHGGKGAAAFALMRRLGLTGLFYIGDDGADEEVFALRRGLAMGIHVGHGADSQAEFYVDHQGEVEDVIRFLVHRMDRTPEAADIEQPKRAPQAG